MPTAFLEKHPALGETGVIDSSTGRFPIVLCTNIGIRFNDNEIQVRTLVVCPTCGEEVLVESVIE